MNRKSQIAVIVVLALLVVMFGVGMFFTGPVSTSVVPSSTSSPSSSGAPSPSQNATQVVQYVPPALSSSTAVEKGSCWTNSIAAPFRGDAWRCSVGNNISDPCFQIPGDAHLLCDVNPNKPDSTSTFALALTKALPKSQPVQGLQPSGSGWLIELQGGTLCTPFTGTLPFTADGETASYGCAPGPLGNDLVIFNIDSSSDVWMATVGTLGPAPANSTSGLPVVATSSTVPITKAWQ